MPAMPETGRRQADGLLFGLTIVNYYFYFSVAFVSELTYFLQYSHNLSVPFVIELTYLCLNCHIISVLFSDHPEVLPQDAKPRGLSPRL